jgi:putative DNA primase/helicase
MSQRNRNVIFLDKLPRGMSLRHDGVHAVERHEDGTTSETWLCGYLRAVCLARKSGSHDWHLQCEFEDMDGELRTLLLPRDKLGTGNHAIAALLKAGLDIHHDPARRRQLARLLSQLKPARRALLTRRLGWQEGERTFVLADGTAVGPEDVIYEGADRIAEATRGTLEGWRTGVARHAVGNDLLTVALSLALAGPLLRPLKAPSGLLHMYGGSSTGKSTILAVAASVFTGPQHVESWRVTDSALESVAEAHSGRCLLLDELGEVDGKHFSAASYMLSNGKGRGRLLLSTSGRAHVPRWELLGLSTGEISVARKLAKAGIELKDGQKARLLDIAVDGRRHGAFDALHGFPTGRHFSEALLAAARENHGTAGRAMVELILSDMDSVLTRARAAMAAFEALVEEKRPDAHGWIHGRVRQRFALLAAAGELASAAGLTGWPEGSARDAAYAVYERWLDAQGPSPEARERAMDAAYLDRLRLFLKTDRARIRDLDQPLVATSAAEKDEPRAWRKAGCLHLPAVTWAEIFGEAGAVAAKRLVALQAIEPDRGGDLMRKLPRETGQGGRRGYKVRLEALAADAPAEEETLP